MPSWINTLFVILISTNYQDRYSQTVGTEGTAEWCEQVYHLLQTTKYTDSPLQKHYTTQVVHNCNQAATAFGATMRDVIQSGIANPDSEIGVYAPDPDAYPRFASLFMPIIKEYHSGFEASGQQGFKDYVSLVPGKTAEIRILDPEGRYVISTRIRLARNIKGYPFNPLMTESQYLDVEARAAAVLSRIQDEELAGTYISLVKMSPNDTKQLIDEHLLFKTSDRFLEAANGRKHWPKGRGIFYNKAKTFLVWCNEEDHLRIISLQQGGDLGAVFKRLRRGYAILASQISFVRNAQLGWLTSCPTNVGSTVRASVLIRLPLISTSSDFKKRCAELGLQVRGVDGEHSRAVDGIYDISNKKRLGLSAYDAVMVMHDGVKKLIQLEEAAEVGLQRETEGLARPIRYGSWYEQASHV